MSDETGGVRVRTFPGLCNGVGNCHRWAPRVYSLDRDGLIAIHLVDVPPELAAEARLGAQVCPERAITIIEQPHGIRTPAGRSTDTTEMPGA